MEEERPDALEVAAQKDQERKKAKEAAQVQIILFEVLFSYGD